MYVAKALPAALFAAIAAAHVSVDIGSIQSLASDLQKFCGATGQGLSQVLGNYGAISGAISGAADDSINAKFSKLQRVGSQFQQVCGQIVSGLNSIADPYAGSESNNAGVWG